MYAHLNTNSLYLSLSILISFHRVLGHLTSLSERYDLPHPWEELCNKSMVNLVFGQVTNTALAEYPKSHLWEIIPQIKETDNVNYPTCQSPNP
jgi:hypothetical protein